MLAEDAARHREASSADISALDEAKRGAAQALLAAEARHTADAASLQKRLRSSGEAMRQMQSTLAAAFGRQESLIAENAALQRQLQQARSDETAMRAKLAASRRQAVLTPQRADFHSGSAWSAPRPISPPPALSSPMAYPGEPGLRSGTPLPTAAPLSPSTGEWPRGLSGERPVSAPGGLLVTSGGRDAGLGATQAGGVMDRAFDGREANAGTPLAGPYGDGLQGRRTLSDAEQMRIRRLLLQAQRRARMSANHANYWQRQFQSQQQLTDDLSGQLDVLSTQHAEALRELSSEGQGQVELLQRERDLWRTRAREAEDRLRGTLAARVTKAESPATQAAGDGQRGLSALQPQAEPSTAGEVAESAKHPPSTPGNLGIGGGASDSGSDWEDGPIRPSTLGALGDAEGPPIDAAKAEEVPSPAQAAAPGDLPASDPVKSAATIATLSQANTALEAKVRSVSRMLADAEARLRRDRAALDDARTRAIKAESQARAAAFQSAQTAIDEANRTADRARAQERESASAADEARSEAAVLRLRLHRAEGLVTSLRTKVQGLEAAAHAAAAREREMATQLSAESHRGAVAEGETRSATSQHEADIRRLRIALATVHAEKAEAIIRLSSRAADAEAARAWDASDFTKRRESLLHEVREARASAGALLLRQVATSWVRRGLRRAWARMQWAVASTRSNEVASRRARAARDLAMEARLSERDEQWRTAFDAALRKAQSLARKHASRAVELASSAARSLQRDITAASLAEALQQAEGVEQGQSSATVESKHGPAERRVTLRTAAAAVSQEIRKIRFSKAALLPPQLLRQGDPAPMARPATSAADMRHSLRSTLAPPLEARAFQSTRAPTDGRPTSAPYGNPLPLRPGGAGARGSGVASLRRRPQARIFRTSSEDTLGGHALHDDLGGSLDRPGDLLVTPMAGRTRANEGGGSPFASPSALASGFGRSTPRAGTPTSGSVGPSSVMLERAGPGWLQPTPGTPGSALGLFTHDIQRALERARADEARRRELAEDAAEQAQSQALMATATAQKTIGEAVAEAERALLIKMGDAEAVAVQEAHEAGRREGEAQAEASSQSERQRLLDKLRLETNATLKAVRDASMRRAEQIVLEERRKSEAAVRDLSQALQEAEAREAQAERSTSALQARIAELQEQHLADASALRTEADRALQDVAERVETLTRKHEDELERLHEELRRASRPPAADASPKAVDDDADAKREEAWRAREAELEARFSEQIIAQAEAHERTIQDVTWQWQTKHAQVQAELAEANAMLAAPRPRPPSQGRLSDAPTPDAETERVRPLPVIATKAAAAAVSAQLDPGSPSGPEPVPKAADAGQQAEAESPECRSAAAAQQPQSTGGALAPDAAEASAKAAEFHASVAQARAEISADFAARLQAAAQAKQAALARMEQELKEDLERAVAEERSRGAAEREQAVSRVEEHAAAAINVLEVKLRAAVQAKKRAESLADSLQVSLDVAKREAVQSAFKAELFHKVSMLLRLRLAVAAARYTAEYCSRTSEVKRALGKRIVLLESRYESDVVAHKKRADAAIKRCVSVEHALLGVASIVGLQFESSMAAASSAGHQLLTDRPGQETALTTACLDGSGTGEAARRAKRELMETQDRVFAIKAELAELREELEAARAKRDHVVGVARFLDMEINQLGRQVALSSTAANEIVASRLQRLHKRLEADLSTAEVVRSRIHELEGRIDVLKDERRGLKLRGRAIEAGVLEKVVKQHMDVRALLHATQLGPEALLPARMGRLPEPPPLRLAMLEPRHALDVDGYEYDLGRRDYLRARAVKEGAAALKRLRSGTARASRPAGAAKASGDEEPDPDSDCPALRLLPAALFSEESKKVRQPEAEHIHDLLHSSEYEAAAGPGYGEAAARGHIVASGSAASAAAANELAKRVQSTGGLLFAGGSASAPSASSASFASGADRTSAGSGPDSSRAALSADDARILNALVPLASARQ